MVYMFAINGEDSAFFAHVCNFITNERWDVSEEFSKAFPKIAGRIRQVPLPLWDIEDTLIWPYSSTDDLSFRDAYQFLGPSILVP